MEQAIERACSGSGCLVALGGEAGIGKSTLLEHLGEKAANAGCLMLTGRCYDFSMTPPYGPWLEIINSPQIDDGRNDPGPADPSESQRPPGTLGRAQEVFERLAERQPLLIALEDIHWADEASLDALRSIGRNLADLPILLVITYREDELNRHHPLSPLLPVILRESRGESISLRPLARDDIDTWVRSRYGLDGATVGPLVDYLERYSDGNPFFIGELLRSLEEDRLIEQTATGTSVGELGRTHVPLVLRQVLERRLDGIDDDARELLSVAAVIGQRVSIDLWQRVTGTDLRELERAIGTAVAAGVLASSDEPGGVAFRHALIREVLYEDTLPTRRQVWHRLIAEALQAEPEPDPDEVAHHLRQAGDPRAVEWLIRAGDRAYRGAYALKTAARRYEAALEIVGTRHDLLSTRGWLLIRLALVRRYADAAPCVLLLNDAYEVALRLGDEAMAAMALWVRGTMRFLAGENGLADVEAGDAALGSLDPQDFQRIRRELGGRLPEEVARRAGLVWWQGYHGRPADALDLADRVLNMPGAANLSAIDRGVCEAGRSFALSVLGRIHEARASFHQARRLLEERRYSFHVTTVTAFEFYLLDLPYFTTDLEERRRKVGLMLEFAARGLQEMADVPPNVAIADHILISGAWDEFSDMLDAIGTSPGSIFIWNYAIPVLATHARYTGQYDRARALLRRVLPQGSQTDVGATGVPLRSLEGLRLGGMLAMDAGDLAAAADWITAHDRWLAWSGYVLGRAEGALLHARYHHLRGDLGTAREWSVEALEHASNPSQPLALIAVHRLLANLDLDEAQHESARQHLDAALALADACAAPYERALTLIAGARVDLATSDVPAAVASLEEAIATCRRLGAAPALDEAEQLLDAARTRSDDSPLSGRELEVLALVADGLTDREVAERLFISPRTVNQHLRSIYNKLGVSSRAAATRKGIEIGLL